MNDQDLKNKIMAMDRSVWALELELEPSIYKDVKNRWVSLKKRLEGEEAEPEPDEDGVAVPFDFDAEMYW